MMNFIFRARKICNYKVVMTKLVFFFDVMSPYTYVAWQILKRYRWIWKLNIDFRPFFLGGVMTGSGNQPPAFIPNKAQFLVHDMRRNIEWLKLENQFQTTPVNFFGELPKISRSISRLLCVCLGSLSVDKQWLLVDAAFHVIWEDPRYRSKENEFVLPHGEDGILKDILDRAGVVRSGGEFGDGKAELKANTDQVLELKGFGSPVLWFPDSSDRDIFFGSDRFEQIAHVLNLPWYGVNPKIGKSSSL
jgi:glutathione S-transferase kappa 1